MSEEQDDIVPLVLYATPVWGGYANSHLNRLPTAQNKCLKCREQAILVRRSCIELMCGWSNSFLVHYCRIIIATIFYFNISGIKVINCRHQTCFPLQQWNKYRTKSHVKTVFFHTDIIKCTKGNTVMIFNSWGVLNQRRLSVSHDRMWGNTKKCRYKWLRMT